MPVSKANRLSTYGAAADACTGSHEYDQLAINLLINKSINMANEMPEITKNL